MVYADVTVDISQNIGKTIELKRGESGSSILISTGDCVVKPVWNIKEEVSSGQPLNITGSNSAGQTGDPAQLNFPIDGIHIVSGSGNLRIIQLV